MITTLTQMTARTTVPSALARSACRYLAGGIAVFGADLRTWGTPAWSPPTC